LPKLLSNIKGLGFFWNTVYITIDKLHELRSAITVCIVQRLEANLAM